MLELADTTFARDEYVVRGTVAYAIGGDQIDGPRLMVCNIIGTSLVAESLTDAYNVEDWTGTHWENMDPSRDQIDEFRDIIMVAIGHEDCVPR
jgi:hypothetical protein